MNVIQLCGERASSPKLLIMLTYSVNNGDTSSKTIIIANIKPKVSFITSDLEKYKELRQISRCPFSSCKHLVGPY